MVATTAVTVVNVRRSSIFSMVFYLCLIFLFPCELSLDCINICSKVLWLSQCFVVLFSPLMNLTHRPLLDQSIFNKFLAELSKIAAFCRVNCLTSPLVACVELVSLRGDQRATLVYKSLIESILT